MSNLHGGNIDFFSNKYGVDKKNLIDFSGNINPLGVSPYLRMHLLNNINLITTYPDISYKELRLSIEGYSGVCHEKILVGNGTTELISLFIKTINPTNSMIIVPAYSEYVRELNNIGAKVKLFKLFEEDDFKINVDKLILEINESIQLLIICNPNNPTGSVIGEADISKILDKCLENDVYLMIDETYVEFCSDEIYNNSAKLIEKYSNLFIIRGTSKFFSIPGLRLGYAFCNNPRIIQKINDNKIPWSVNSLAASAGVVIFKDYDFILKTKNLIATERKKMITEIRNFGSAKVYNSNANFILIKLLNSDKNSECVFIELMRRNILVREASSFDFLNDSFIRFCILSPENNQLLLEALRDLIT
jgi:threonine-phosphate decarboxylase